MSNNQMVSVPRERLREFIENAACLGRSPQWVKNKAALLEALTQPGSQHQSEPVALPGRKDPTQHWVEPGGPYKAYGWNACLDEIAKLGPLYTRPAQGEPVAHMYRALHDGLDSFVCLGKPGSSGPNYEAVPLYTHADPAEVESRLSEQRAEFAKASQTEHTKWSAEVERLRNELEEWKKRCQRNSDEAMSWMSKHDTLRAPLAEQNSLLREVLEAFKLEADGSCINPGRDFIRPWAAKLAALSASAEPRAPVERDERAEFDAWCVKHGRVLGYCGWREDFVIWKTRAALERKP